MFITKTIFHHSGSARLPKKKLRHAVKGGIDSIFNAEFKSEFKKSAKFYFFHNSKFSKFVPCAIYEISKFEPNLFFI